MLIICFLLLAGGGVGYSLFHYLSDDKRQLAEMIDQQTAELSTLTDRLNHSEQMRVNAEVASSVDRQALEQIRGELVSWNQKYSALEDKINFYQSLMEPKASHRGIYIEAVDIAPLGAEGVYSYRVLVAQRSNIHDRVTGTLSLELVSSESGDGILLVSSPQFFEDDGERKLGFKFFQQREGRFRVPESFQPTSVNVVVSTKGKSSVRVEKTLEWNRGAKMSQITSFGG